MLTVTNDLSSYTLAAGEPFVLEVQLLDSAGRGTDINDTAMFLTFYSGVNRAIVSNFTGLPAQYEGVRLSDGTGEFFRFAFDGRFSEGMFGKPGVRVELAQRLLNGRKVLATGALSVIASAITVPSLGGAVIADRAIRATIKDSPTFGGQPLLSVLAVPYDPATSPAPIFTTQPSLSPLSVTVGNPITVTPGIATGATQVVGIARFNNALVDLDEGQFTPSVAGTFTYQEVATGLSGAETSSDLLSATVTAAGSDLPRAAVATPLHKNVAASNVALLNVPDGATVTLDFPGLTVNSAARTLSGTPTALSGLVTYEMADGRKRNSIIFAPKTTQPKTRMWMGTSGIAYYYPNRVFLDYLKTSDWLTPPATVDANGMPLTLGIDGNGNRTASANIWVDGGTVKWHLVTDGDISAQDWVPDEHGYSRTTSRSAGGVGLLTFTRISSTNPPTYMALVRDDELSNYLDGEVSRPSYRTATSKFDGIRAMNWNGGNFDNPIPNRPAALSYSKNGPIGGVPLDTILQVCRECGPRFSLHFNVHVDLTTAEFVADYLPKLRAFVAEGRRVKLEYSNEITFNLSFAQWTKARDYAFAAGYNDPQSPNYDPQGDQYTAPSWWLGKRIAELCKAVRGSGIEPMVGVQTVQQTHFLQFLKKGMAQTPDVSLSEFRWYITHYAGGPFSEPASSPELIAKMDALIAANDTDAIWHMVCNYIGPMPAGYRNSMEANRLWLNEGRQIVADNNMMGLDTYEGALDFVTGRWGYGSARDIAYNPVLYAIQADVNAEGAARQLNETMDECGVAEATWFDDDSDPGATHDGRYGTFGLPARIAIDEWNALAAPPAPTIYNTPGTSSLPGAQVAGFVSRADAIDAQLTALGV